jgi:hypothetical protein
MLLRMQALEAAGCLASTAVFVAEPGALLPPQQSHNNIITVQQLKFNFITFE